MLLRRSHAVIAVLVVQFPFCLLGQDFIVAGSESNGELLTTLPVPVHVEVCNYNTANVVGSLDLDLDQNGSTDVTMAYSGTGGLSGGAFDVRLVAAAGNAVAWGRTDSAYGACPLSGPYTAEVARVYHAGDTVQGGSHLLHSANQYLFLSNSNPIFCYCNCVDDYGMDSIAYAGIAFQTDDGVHYGWIKMHGIYDLTCATIDVIAFASTMAGVTRVPELRRPLRIHIPIPPRISFT